MSVRSDDAIERYLEELDRALAGVPHRQQASIVQEIRDHIDIKMSASTDHSTANIAAILAELGSPMEIGNAARLAHGGDAGRLSGRDISTIFLLLIGGVILPILGWLVGVYLLWTSLTWRTREKLIGTCLFPGGLAVPLYIISMPSTGTCTGSGGPNQATVVQCSGGLSGLTLVAVISVAAVGTIGAVFSAVWLSRAAKRANGNV